MPRYAIRHGDGRERNQGRYRSNHRSRPERGCDRQCAHAAGYRIHSIGVDEIAVNCATAVGFPAPESNRVTVAEHTIALMLGVEKRTHGRSFGYRAAPNLVMLLPEANIAACIARYEQLRAA